MRAQHQVIACRCHGVKGRLQGFTLLEMLLVMTLAALVLTVVPASFSAMLPRVERQAEIKGLVVAIRKTRGMAIRERREVSLILDLRRNQYHQDGTERVTRLSEDFILHFVDPFSIAGASPDVALRFFADGSSSGGIFTFEAQGEHYQIDVNWLTGKVSYRENV